jgi:endothelin-converting enzyme/putative endopeptidase
MGIKPLLPYLAKIDKVKSVKDLQQLLIEMEPIGGIGFIGVGVGADDKIVPKNSLNWE